MLKFKMIKEEQGTVMYQYNPEGGVEYGIVSYNKKTEELEVVKLAQNDKRKVYALKMFSRIRKMASAGSYDKDGMIAWY